MAAPALQTHRGYDVSLQYSATANKQRQQAETPAEDKTHKQQHPEHIPHWEQEQTECNVSLCVYMREQVPFSDSTRPSRSEIREGTDEVNLTKVIKLTTDTRELGSDIGLGY